MWLNATSNCPGWNAFCLQKFRLTAAFDKLSPCSLWMLHAYMFKRHCVCVILQNFDFVKYNVNWFRSIGTRLLLLPKLQWRDALIPALKSSNLTYILRTCWWLDMKWQAVPICPLIKHFSISMFHVNINFAPILSFKECAKLPVILSFALFNNSMSVSENTKLIRNISIALMWTHSVLSWLISNALRASAGGFSVNKCKVTIGYEISFCKATIDLIRIPQHYLCLNSNLVQLCLKFSHCE